MNRRTFVKLTGITLISTQTLASIDEPLIWTPLRKQMPKVGQKVILLARYKPFITREDIKFNLHIITVGRRVPVKDTFPKIVRRLPSIALKQEFRISSSYNSNTEPLLFYSPKITPYPLEEIKKLKWGKIRPPYRKIDNLKSNKALHWMIDNMHWLPVLNKLPITLPIIPKYEYSTK